MRKPGEVTDVGTIVSEVKAFDHKFFPVVERVVQTPSGEVREPQLLWDRYGKQFVGAVVRDEQGQYVLVEEPKYGQMRRMVSVPTGGVKKGETLLAAAQREFLEETGYEASDWEPLCEGPIVDFADKSDGGEHHFFTARHARKVREPRSTEQKVILATSSESRVLLRSGRIPAISMAALLLATQ